MLTTDTLKTQLPNGYRRKFVIMQDEDEMRYLYHMGLQGGEILEIGTGPGGSALLMSQGIRDANVQGHVTTIGYEAEAHYYGQVDGRFAKFPELTVNITKIQGKSSEVFYIVKNKRFDFIYIDGDHSYEAVCSDILNYVPLLKPGGVVAFHDTNKDEVQKAIDDTLQAAQTVEIYRIKGYTLG